MNIFDVCAVVLVVVFVFVFIFSGSFNAVSSTVAAIFSSFAVRFIEDPLINLMGKYGWKESLYTPPLVYVLLFVLFWGIFYTFFSYLPNQKTYHNKWLKYPLALLSAAVVSIVILNIACISLPAFLGSTDAQTNLKNSLICLDCTKPVFSAFKPKSLQTPIGRAITPQNDTAVISLPNDFSFLGENPIYESRALTLLNQTRSDNSINKLTRSSELDQLALGYANEIIQTKRFSHIDSGNQTPSDRATASSISFDYFGENLAVAPTVEKANDIMLASSTHRANILSIAYREVGIAVIDVAPGEILVVEEFSN